jgi:hypothetical protein
MRGLTSGLQGTGKIENLSVGGCRIVMEQPQGFRQGESVEMTFCVRQLPLRVQASVRQLHYGHAVGVAFTLLSERGKLQLLSLIDELAEVHRDQVEALVQQQSLLAAVPSEHRNGPCSAVPGETAPMRAGGGSVPINRDHR